MRRITAVTATALMMVGLTAGPAMAHHDHKLTNPGGCHTIPVGHQAHTGDDPGNKFHGAAHAGAATEGAFVDGVGTLGRGNSRVTVAGGAC